MKLTVCESGKTFETQEQPDAIAFGADFQGDLRVTDSLDLRAERFQSKFSPLNFARKLIRYSHRQHV